MEEIANQLENVTMRINSNKNNEIELESDISTLFYEKESQRSPSTNLKLPSDIKMGKESVPASFGTFATTLNNNSTIKAVNFNSERVLEDKFTELKHDLFGRIENHSVALDNIINSHAKLESMFMNVMRAKTEGNEFVRSSKKAPKVSEHIFEKDEINFEDESEDDTYLSRKSKKNNSSNTDSRRKSFYQEVTKRSKRSKEPVMFRQQPSYKHITLDGELNIKNVMDFISSISAYEITHGIELPVSTMVSEKTVDKIAGRLGTTGVAGTTLDFHNFIRLTREQVMEALQIAVRPKSMNEFQQTLQSQVKFEIPDGYRLKVINFNQMYESLVTYQQKFIRYFDFMSEGNFAHIPHCENKDGGLIKIFLSNIPFEYGTKTFSTMTLDKDVLNRHKADSSRAFDYFLKAFMEKVKEDQEKSIEAQTLDLKFEKHREVRAEYGRTFAKTETTSSVKPSNYSSPPFRSFGNKAGSNTFKRQVNSITNTKHYQEYESEDESEHDSEYEQEDDHFRHHQQDKSMVHESFEQSKNFNENENENTVYLDSLYHDIQDSYFQQFSPLREDHSKQVLAGLSNSGPKTNPLIHKHRVVPSSNTSSSSRSAVTLPQAKSAPNGCFSLLLYGECNRGDRCTYSHVPEVLTKTILHVEEKFKHSRFYPSSESKRSISSALHVLNMCCPNTNDLDTSFLHPHLHHLLERKFWNEMPEAVIKQAVFRSGCLNLPQRILALENVLFDSGALQSSYISLAFINRHRVWLSSFLHEVDISVDMADGKTSVHINECLIVPVEFVDSSENLHKAEIVFCVLEMAQAAIIGLPDILRSFFSLYKDMMESSLDQLPPLPSVIVNALDITNIHSDETSNPWTDINSQDLEAPEDRDTPLPVSFSYALHFMEMSVKEAEDEYYSLFASHIHPDFAKAAPVEALLRNKGLRVFVPQNWEGINGIPPLELSFRDDMPITIKPKARPINPKLYEHAKLEFDRLLKYFYEPCESPVASCLVIAPKATKPFIRFCGDYRQINAFVVLGHYPIPHVALELQKICRFSVFIDLDWVNSFHQILLGPVTSNHLSIQTPWGQFRPKFLPEGVGPASGVLQSVVANCFSDFTDWTIAIFDNLLVLATDYQDAYQKLELILDRCLERNIFLKFTKSWIGFDHANFFGYVCKHMHYEMSQDRKDSLMNIPFPSSQKQMQSFLGSALFFKSFVPSYSEKSAPLNDMVHQNLPWHDPSAWTVNYVEVFTELKQALQDARALYYPDYALDWVLRTDASDFGVASVLLMLQPIVDTSPVQYSLLPISFDSQKFSGAATRWHTLEKEAFGCYFGIFKNAYLLRCKPFVLETDHNNLIWIEASSVPKVMRWRIFMQSFVFTLRHIPGKLNRIADYLSRMHLSSLLPSSSSTSDTSSLDLFLSVLPALPLSQPTGEDGSASTDTNNDPSLKFAVDDALRQVHGGRMAHAGVRKTWQALNKYFPGHRVPIKYVEAFVSECPVCQKDRLGLTDSLKPLIRHLKPIHQRSMVGVDTLTVTPVDKFGNSYLTVVVNHCTKHSYGYAAAQHDALSTATALFQYFTTFGVTDSIISDPGTEFTNEMVQHLHKWFGIRFHFSLVDRHESNGVEGTNKLILRHLRALVYDERVKSQWSSPTILPIIFFIMNSTDSSETGIIPFHAHFGSEDSTYFRMTANMEELDKPHQFVKLLDDNLKLLRSISAKFQSELVAERTSENPSSESFNTYSPGDYVLSQLDLSVPRPSKLHPRFIGPFEVVQQIKNDVECRNLITGAITTIHVGKLKPFFGSYEKAFLAAQLDNDQFLVSSILAYKGDPLKRTTMEFEVLFADGSIVWLPYSRDLYTTAIFEDFCRLRPALLDLLYPVEIASRNIRSLNQRPIDEIVLGQVVYVDLRSYSANNSLWYENLGLPDWEHLQYVVESVYTGWVNARRNKVNIFSSVFDESFACNHHWVRSYGTCTDLDPTTMVLVDIAFVLQYPQVLPEATRALLLKQYRA